VIKIGKDVSAKEAHCEFVGLAIFSENGLRLFRQVYDAAVDLRGNGRFHESLEARRASLTDVLQELIDQGHSIECIEVSSGWMEIHSFDDYKQACSLLARAG
jgi:phosphoenolpyruvate phosphomutase